MDQRISRILSEFCIDPTFGFLLPSPQQKLPPQYKPWHDLVDSLPEILDEESIEKKVMELPLIGTDLLFLHHELRLAHLLLATIAAAYIWHRGSSQPNLKLPRQVGIPFISVSEKLRMKPVVCHASMCLANWRIIDKNGSFRAENIELIGFVFTRHIGNQWFFTLTAQIETEFAPAILAIAKACAEEQIFEDTFEEIRKSLAVTAKTITRMNEHLPPAVFYHGFRLYLNGYTDGEFKKQGGIIFEGREDLKPQAFCGASAAQSSPLHVLDSFLQTKHSEKEQRFLEEQRHYMPVGHRRFIEWVTKQSGNIGNLQEHPGYREAVTALKNFRSQHIKVVAEYIILQMKPGEQSSGTGGSSVMGFLKSIRDNCRL